MLCCCIPILFTSALFDSLHCAALLLVITAVIVSVWFAEMTSGFHLCDRSLSLLSVCYYGSSRSTFPAFIPPPQKKASVFFCVLQKLQGGKISAAFSETSESLLTWRMKLTVCISVPVRSAGRASGTRLSDTDLLLAGVWGGSSPPATLPSPPHAGAAASCSQTKHTAGWNVLLLITFIIQNVKITFGIFGT